MRGIVVHYAMNSILYVWRYLIYKIYRFSELTVVFLTLSPQKIIHKQNVTGNMDQGRRWYFESHTWIVWNGMPIDVLFGQFGVVSHQTNIRTVYEDNDDFFYQAGNVHFYLKNVSLFDRYTTKEEDRFRYNQ